MPLTACAYRAAELLRKVFVLHSRNMCLWAGMAANFRRIKSISYVAWFGAGFFGQSSGGKVVRVSVRFSGSLMLSWTKSARRLKARLRSESKSLAMTADRSRSVLPKPSNESRLH